MPNSKTIVFIHGLHENANTWEEWKSFFEDLGYKCHAPHYPYHEGSPANLRQNPNKQLANIRLKDVVAHFIEFINQLEDQCPILIGHSMGGLIVQKLIQEQKGALGICITSASPKGILTLKWSFVKSNFGVVNPFKGNKLYCGTREWFHYAICNTLTREESDEIYDKAVVPESRNIPRTSRLSDGEIDFNKPHKPLLFISADKDHIIPIGLTIQNVKAYKDNQSITDFRAFKGKSHSICVQSGWEEVAHYIRRWIVSK
jgi:pimeloyl-ACP methyl ester carboxylesterase